MWQHRRKEPAERGKSKSENGVYYDMVCVCRDLGELNEKSRPVWLGEVGFSGYTLTKYLFARRIKNARGSLVQGSLPSRV